ncbi:MAG: hypothetical protein PHT12_02515 [Patescibacteria group bacterium]|nr:hypothetical protein [Patescibacteria group bacterium]
MINREHPTDDRVERQEVAAGFAPVIESRASLYHPTVSYEVVVGDRTRLQREAAAAPDLQTGEADQDKRAIQAAAAVETQCAPALSERQITGIIRGVSPDEARERGASAVAGRLASAAAADALRLLPPGADAEATRRFLSDTCRQARDTVDGYAKRRGFKNIDLALDLLRLVQDEALRRREEADLVFAHAGDGRIYVLDGETEEFRCLTADDALAKQAPGGKADVKSGLARIRMGDRVFVVSAGVHHNLSEEALARLLAEGGVRAAAERAEAVAFGGSTERGRPGDITAVEIPFGAVQAETAVAPADEKGDAERLAQLEEKIVRVSGEVARLARLRTAALAIKDPKLVAPGYDVAFAKARLARDVETEGGLAEIESKLRPVRIQSLSLRQEALTIRAGTAATAADQLRQAHDRAMRMRIAAGVIAAEQAHRPVAGIMVDPGAGAAVRQMLSAGGDARGLHDRFKVEVDETERRLKALEATNPVLVELDRTTRELRKLQQEEILARPTARPKPDSGSIKKPGAVLPERRAG